jgi:hypothetical protein
MSRSSSSRTSLNQPSSSSTSESTQAQAVGAFLRNLAARAETDSDLAREIQSALVESGLLASGDRARPGRENKARQDKRDRAKGLEVTQGSEVEIRMPYDPFRVLLE